MLVCFPFRFVRKKREKDTNMNRREAKDGESSDEGKSFVAIFSGGLFTGSFPFYGYNAKTTLVSVR